jgi:hypothetical protein
MTALGLRSDALERVATVPYSYLENNPVREA